MKRRLQDQIVFRTRLGSERNISDFENNTEIRIFDLCNTAAQYPVTGSNQEEFRRKYSTVHINVMNM